MTDELLNKARELSDKLEESFDALDREVEEMNDHLFMLTGPDGFEWKEEFENLKVSRTSSSSASGQDIRIKVGIGIRSMEEFSNLEDREKIDSFPFVKEFYRRALVAYTEQAKQLLDEANALLSVDEENED